MKTAIEEESDYEGACDAVREYWLDSTELNFTDTCGRKLTDVESLVIISLSHAYLNEARERFRAEAAKYLGTKMEARSN